MTSLSTAWNPKQALLKEIILKPDRFDEAVNLCLDMHALVHSSEMSHVSFQTFEDQLWDGLSETVFRTMPTPNDVTIAWNIWHLSRIEDLTVNLLTADDHQVLNQLWLDKMNVTVRDTGNAMTDHEIIALSSLMNCNELRNYRIAVGRKTREIIKQLQPVDMKRKVRTVGLKRIFEEGGVVEESKWLLDFWGKKTIAGILLMPVTRHQVVHIHDSLKIKNKTKALLTPRG